MDASESIALTCQYVVAFVFLGAATPKLFDVAGFEQAVRNYDLLNEQMSTLVARWLPRLELACGIALLVSIGVVVAATLTFCLLVVFSIAVAINLARDRRIECGCRGTVAPRELGWSLVVGNLALAGIAGAAAFRVGGEGLSHAATSSASEEVFTLSLSMLLVLTFHLLVGWRKAVLALSSFRKTTEGLL